MAFLTPFDLLALHDVTVGMPSKWLRRLAAGGCSVTYQPGDRLFQEEAVAARIWLIDSGTVTLDGIVICPDESSRRLARATRLSGHTGRPVVMTPVFLGLVLSASRDASPRAE
jgi:hypothetical protein